jgi:steroid delta-isomerase-like uncharacterized protein
VTREEIVQFFDRRAALFTALDAAGLTAGHAEGCLYESPLAGKVIGRPAIEKVYRGLFTSFPDCTLEITDLIIDGDRAVQIAVFSGTDRGGFMNLPPSGRKSSFPIVFSFVFKDGLIERETVVYDFTGWLVQIGVLKAKPQ